MDLNKLQKEYENERKAVPDFALGLPINNHLQSFENYLSWRKKMKDFFDDMDYKNTPLY